MNKLPTSYADLNWKKYVAIINTIPSEKPADCDSIMWSRLVNLTTLSILLDTTINDIEQLRATEVFELIKGIEFMDKPFTQHETRFKIKGIKELTYDEFANYQALRVDQWNNLEAIIKIMVKDITPVEIDSLSIDDVMQIFFLSKRSTKKFLTRLRYSLLLKIVRQKISQSLPFQKR